MPEHQSIEWKESWRDEYLKWISGLANADGGTLVIGKNDKGEIIGVDKAKKLTEDLPNKIKNMLGLLPEVNLRVEANKEYIEIKVESSKSPVAYKGQFYLRRGSTNQLLDGIALSDFILEKSNMNWDEVPVSGTSIDDIDRSAIKKFKQEARKSGRIRSLTDETSTKDVLKNLKLISDAGELKRAAVILFCKNPEDFIITANVKIGRFGESHADLRSQELVEGNHFEIADKIIEIIDYKYVIRNISYDGLTRVETPEYPFEAIREAIFNAIIHRKYESTSIYISIYEDHLEIWNEGLLHKDLTIDDLKRKHLSHPRNPLMATIFYKAGFIETWGRGTIKILEEAKKYGLPEPKIHEYSGGVAITLFKKPPYQQPEESGELSLLRETNRNYLSTRESWVIDFLERNQTITSKDYQKQFELAERTARYHLSKMVEKGLIVKSGTKSGSFYVLKK